MKLNKIAYLALATLAFAACSMDDVVPQGGTLLASQVQEIKTAVPERAEASFSGMFTKLGEPNSVFSDRPDDFGFISIAFSGDVEAADIVLPNSNYNWFSACGELSSRDPSYANPYSRYAGPYNTIANANEIIKSYPEDTQDPNAINQIAQARAIRAFAYLNLAPYFQFSFAAGGADKPSVPISTEKTEDYTNNPRASMTDMYNFILEDLNYAIEKLEGYVRPNKSRIDQQVAYGLRARAYLDMQKWAEAAADAGKAMEGYTPATMAEVSRPFLYDINEHNWIWGYDMTPVVAAIYPMATSSSWLRSFSALAYAPAVGVYAACNRLLYDKIPATDVRKGWWVDENLESPLLQHVTWDGVSGNAVATLEIPDEKMVFLPYTNVKFGMFTVGGDTNEEDWCFMRAEEMLLIQIEGLAKSGQEAKAKEMLENFVKTYRNPAYVLAQSSRTFADEIWFQRRVELWGEGFANTDTRRLAKPLVRFIPGKKTNMPEAFRFNMPADDPWWLMRFTDSETNTNFGIVDNTGGKAPVQDQYPELRDGVTD